MSQGLQSGGLWLNRCSCQRIGLTQFRPDPRQEVETLLGKPIISIPLDPSNVASTFLEPRTSISPPTQAGKAWFRKLLRLWRQRQYRQIPATQSRGGQVCRRPDRSQLDIFSVCFLICCFSLSIMLGAPIDEHRSTLRSNEAPYFFCIRGISSSAKRSARL